MTDLRAHAATAAWLVVGGVSLFILLAAALGVAGFLAGGPAAPPGPVPTVDHADPPAEVTADALAELGSRDHTWEWWLAGRNRSSGERSRGIVIRVAVEHSAGRVRMDSWGTRTLGLENGTVTPDEPPDLVLFGNRYYYKWQRGRVDDTWQRLYRSGLPYERGEHALGDAPDRFRTANLTVVADNGSALVVRTADPGALATFEPLFRYRRNATATVVVTKGPDPHVRRVTLRNHTGPVVRTETFVVSDVGATDVERPDPAPPVSASEVFARVVTGLQRLFG